MDVNNLSNDTHYININGEITDNDRSSIDCDRSSINCDSSDEEIDIQIKHAKKNIEITKNILIDNIDQVINRGDKIERLVDDTEDLNQSSMKFYQTTKKIKCKICCENFKCTIIISIFIIILLYILLAYLCGGFKLEKCM